MKDDPYTRRLIEMVEAAMKYAGVSYPQMAEMLSAGSGKPSARQGIFKKVKSGTIKATDLMKALECIGMNLRIESDGTIIPDRSAAGERVVRVLKGERYDTKRCCPIANSFYRNGTDRFQDHAAEEMYCDPEKRRYFIAHYGDGQYVRRRGEKKRPWIEIVPEENVDQIIKEHGMK